MTAERVPIRDDLLWGPLQDLAAVRLAGSRCRTCDEVSLGRAALCPNCGGDALEAGPLAEEGVLWTYTVVRNRPPGTYRGPEPFAPFCVGLVELADGIRVVARVEAEIDRVEIGMPLRLRVFVHHRNDAGQEVIGFAFAPAAGAGRSAGGVR